MFYSADNEDEINDRSRRNVKSVSYVGLKHAPAQEEEENEDDDGGEA
jgi:hypothetical protein